MLFTADRAVWSPRSPSLENFRYVNASAFNGTDSHEPLRPLPWQRCV